MPKLPVKLVAALALAGVSLGEVSSAPAQESAAGEVTISDSQREPITEAEPLPLPGDAASPSEAMYPSQFAYSPGYAGASSPGAGSPYMPQGGTPIQHGKDWYGYRNQGPWLRPIRRPIYRVPVQYARYWPTSYYTGGYDPSALYGQPLPVVYQPTDTTQLGFYHQRVPQWQPRPNAIPGPPWPPQWHYVIPVQFGNSMNPGWNAYGQGGYPQGVQEGDGSYGYNAYGYNTQPGLIQPQETDSEDGSSSSNNQGESIPDAPAPAVPAP